MAQGDEVDCVCVYVGCEVVECYLYPGSEEREGGECEVVQFEGEGVHVDDELLHQ